MKFATEFESVAFTSPRTVESPNRHADRVSTSHPVHHFRGFTFRFVEDQLLPGGTEHSNDVGWQTLFKIKVLYPPAAAMSFDSP